MTSNNIILQGLKIAVDTLAAEIAAQRQEAAMRGQYDWLPEWIDLEQAVALKRGIKNRTDDDPYAGGAPLSFYRQKLFLQPCCGLNHKTIGGRRCWKKNDVIEWLSITDEALVEYAQKNNYKNPLPETYKKRGA